MASRGICACTKPPPVDPEIIDEGVPPGGKALWQELSNSKMSALVRRAGEAGVEQSLVDQVRRAPHLGAAAA